MDSDKTFIRQLAKDLAEVHPYEVIAFTCIDLEIIPLLLQKKYIVQIDPVDGRAALQKQKFLFCDPSSYKSLGRNEEPNSC